MTHTRRFGEAVKRMYRRFFRKELCMDCKHKLDKKIGLGHLTHKTKHKGHRGKKHHKSHRKLSPGIHHVKIRGKSRKIRVLPNGRWRFMKG